MRTNARAVTAAPVQTKKWVWIAVALFLLSIVLPAFIFNFVDSANPELPFIENAKGPEAHRVLADGSLPDRSTAIALAADGFVTIGSTRHAIDRAGEFLLAANRVAMDLVVVEVQADVSPAQASQIVRALTESGAAKTVTLKRVP